MRKFAVTRGTFIKHRKCMTNCGAHPLKITELHVRYQEHDDLPRSRAGFTALGHSLAIKTGKDERRWESLAEHSLMTRRLVKTNLLGTSVSATASASSASATILVPMREASLAHDSVDSYRSLGPTSLSSHPVASASRVIAKAATAVSTALPLSTASVLTIGSRSRRGSPPLAGHERRSVAIWGVGDHGSEGGGATGAPAPHDKPISTQRQSVQRQRRGSEASETVSDAMVVALPGGGLSMRPGKPPCDHCGLRWEELQGVLANGRHSRVCRECGVG